MTVMKANSVPLDSRSCCRIIGRMSAFAHRSFHIHLTFAPPSAVRTAVSTHARRGRFREVQPPQKLVHTEGYDPGSVGDVYRTSSEALVTTTFAEEGRITTMMTVIDYGSKVVRDAAMKTGMTDGMEQSYQLLDRLLQEPGF
jgi:uncharacterized protein YndB with AHSA1/START domain